MITRKMLIYYFCMLISNYLIFSSHFLLYIIFQYCRSTSSIDAGDLNEASVANITISNESLAKSGESIIVSGKGMSSTVKVKTFLESNKVYIDQKCIMYSEIL